MSDSKIINIHGCFWHLHGCPRCRIPSSRKDYWVTKLQRNAARDKRTGRKLRRQGWRILTIWECQTQSKQLEHLQNRIAAFLGK